MIEIWKESELKGILISNLGNISAKGNFAEKYYEFDFNGYKAIQTYNHTYYIHRLVAQAFLPNPSNKPCVNHKDGNKKNNCVDNLEWVTHSENNRHAYRTGLKFPNKKTSKHKSVCMLNDDKEIICIFPKMKYANIVFKKDIDNNINRAIKNSSKCEGYYWQYYCNDDIKLKNE